MKSITIFLFMKYPALSSILDKYEWNFARTSEEFAIALALFPLVFNRKQVASTEYPTWFGQIKGVFADINLPDYKGIERYLLKFGLTLQPTKLKYKRTTIEAYIPTVSSQLLCVGKSQTKNLIRTGICTKNGKLIGWKPYIKGMELSCFKISAQSQSENVDEDAPATNTTNTTNTTSNTSEVPIVQNSRVLLDNITSVNHTYQ